MKRFIIFQLRDPKTILVTVFALCFSLLSFVIFNLHTLEFEKENETIAKNIRDKFGLVPSYLASDQRMTPFGISALYLSTQKMACVAEIRALVGQYVGVAQFSNRIELKLLKSFLKKCI